VWIQNTHVVTLTEDHAVNHIHLNAGISSDDGAGNGRINIGTHTLELYGYLAGYRAPVGTVPGIPWNSTIGYSPLGINSNPSGALKIVGDSRSITAPDSYADAFYRFRCVIDPGEGKEITVSFHRFRASEIDVVSGTLNMGANSLRCQSDAVGDPEERLIIRKGAKLISAASGPGNNAVIGRGETTTMASLLIEEGGIFEILGANPRMRVRNIVNNGTILYSREGNQALVRSNGGTDPIELKHYGTLILSGSGTKTIDGLDIEIQDSLIFKGNATLNTTSGGSVEYIGPNSWLVYRGSSTQIPSTTTWRSSSSAMNVLLDNPSGLTITEALDIPSIFRLERGVIEFFETGKLKLLSEADFEGGNLNSYINGPIEVVGDKLRHLPLGKNGLYRPVFGSIAGIGHTFSMEVFDTPVMGTPSDPLVALNNSFHWRLIPITGTLHSGTLTFLYESDDLASEDSDIRIAFSPALDGSFEKKPVVSNDLKGQITVNVNPSGIYTLGTIAPTSVLRFTNFQARASSKQNQINLEWSIITQDNSDKVVIHRSRDGKHWQAVSYFKIDYLNQSLQMSYVDKPNNPGFWYYKLEHRLKSGQSYWSKVLRVNWQFTAAETIKIWYDRQKETLHLALDEQGWGEGFHELQVYSLSGERIYQSPIATSQPSMLAYTIVNLPKGVYLVSLNNSGSKLSRRLIVP
jgi:hypothetical protein